MDYHDYYMRQAGGNHGGIYSGSSRQRGHGLGGVFRSLYRYMVPLLKTHALPVIKSGAKTIGTEALRAATNVGMDALRGDNIKHSLKNNFDTVLSNLHNKANEKLQSGSGRKKRRSFKKTKNFMKTVKNRVHFKKNKKKKSHAFEDIFS